jgi:hypothetical protein
VSAALQSQVRCMLLAPWQWRRNDGSLWAVRLAGAVVVLLLGAPIIAALLWLPPRAALLAVGGCSLLALTLAWGHQVSGLLRLDHPMAARTVPGHAQALRATALGLWLACVAFSGVAAALGSALLLGQGQRFGLAVAVGTGTLLCLLALAMRWWWLWIPLCLGPSFMGVAVWREAVWASGSWLHQQWQAQPLLATVVVLALQGLLIPTLFGQGDERHARAHDRRERLRKFTAASAAGQQPGLAAVGRWGEWLSLPWQCLADAWLAHVCRHAHHGQRSVMARAEIVLHGTQHWVRNLSAGALVVGVVGLCLAITMGLSGVDAHQILAGGRVGIGIGLATMALSAVGSLPGALWHSRREQALLVLLPGMPRGAALNRALAWRQMRHCLWGWALLLPALAAMAWAGQGLTAAALAGPALPMSAWLWRDVARQHSPRPVQAFRLTLVCMVAGGSSLALLSAWPQALLPWAGLLLLLTAGLLVWRWRWLGRLPQALPAGRLG